MRAPCCHPKQRYGVGEQISWYNNEVVSVKTDLIESADQPKIKQFSPEDLQQITSKRFAANLFDVISI